jgi:hypothetical protein
MVSTLNPNCGNFSGDVIVSHRRRVERGEKPTIGARADLDRSRRSVMPYRRMNDHCRRWAVDTLASDACPDVLFVHVRGLYF